MTVSMIVQPYRMKWVVMWVCCRHIVGGCLVCVVEAVTRVVSRITAGLTVHCDLTEAKLIYGISG